MSNYNDKLRFAMTPSGFKAGTLYSQFPNVSASDFEVVRNSIGTRVNKDGFYIRRILIILGGRETEQQHQVATHLQKEIHLLI